MKKPVRKANAMGPKNKKISLYKTAAGAQQYVSGNTSKERRQTLTKLDSRPAPTRPDFRTLGAAGNAQESRVISNIVGKKKAKTDTTVKMYDKLEKMYMSTPKKKK
jgi:hypothetical protein